MGDVQLVNEDDPNQQNKQNSTVGTGAPPPAAGQAPSAPTGSTGTSGSSGGSASTSAPKTGTGFTNLQNLISANSNNQLGNVVGSGISQAAQGVQSGLNQANQQFQSDTNNAASQYDPNTRTDIINQVLGYQAPSGGVNNTGSGTPQTGTSPAAGLSQSQVDQFTNYRAGNYQGPQQLSNYDSLNAQAQNAQALGNNLNSSGGTQSLLQQFVGGNGQYSQGQQTLDNLLLGATGAPQLQQARQQTLGLQDQVNQANAAAQNQAQTEKAMAQQFATDTTNALNNAKTGINTDVTNAYNAAGTTDTNNQNAYNNFVNLITGKTPVQTNAGVGAVGDQTSTPNNPQVMALQQLVGNGLATQQQVDQLSQLINKGYQDTTGGVSGARLGQIQNQLQLDQQALSNVNQNDPDALHDAQAAVANDQQMINTVNNAIASQSPQYASLSTLLGTDQTPQQFLQSGLQYTGPQNYTQNNFVNASQAAQLNALAQLGGQASDPTLANVTGGNPYQASSIKSNIGDLINQIQQKENTYTQNEQQQSLQTLLAQQAAQRAAGQNNGGNLFQQVANGNINAAVGSLPGIAYGSPAGLVGSTTGGLATAAQNLNNNRTNGTT